MQKDKLVRYKCTYKNFLCMPCKKTRNFISALFCLIMFIVFWRLLPIAVPPKVMVWSTSLCCRWLCICLWSSYFGTLDMYICCHCCVELCAQGNEISSDGCDLWTIMKSFSTYNYCAAIATPINAMSFRSLWSKLAAQESVQSYLTQAQTYSSHTVQVFAIGFLKLCACIGLTFLAYSSQKDFWGTEESFLNTHFWLSKKIRKLINLTSQSLKEVIYISRIGVKFT